MKPGCVGRCIYGPCSAVLVIAASGVRRSEGKAAPGDGDIYILYFHTIRGNRMIVYTSQRRRRGKIPTLFLANDSGRATPDNHTRRGKHNKRHVSGIALGRNERRRVCQRSTRAAGTRYPEGFTGNAPVSSR